MHSITCYELSFHPGKKAAQSPEASSSITKQSQVAVPLVQMVMYPYSSVDSIFAYNMA